MKRLFLTLLASGAAIAVAAPAQAAGLQGGRVEGRVGWDSSRLDGEFSIANPVLSATGHNSESGFGFGVEAGYDALVSTSFVLGAYAGANFSSADFCTTAFNADTACLEVGRDLNVGVRAGFAVTPTALIYIKGGYSHGKLKANFDDADGFVTVNPPLVPPVPIGDFDDSKHAGGVHFGIGGEMNFSDNFYGKLEYVRTNYGNANFDGTNIHLGLDARRDQVFLGFGVRF